MISIGVKVMIVPQDWLLHHWLADQLLQRLLKHLQQLSYLA